MMKNPRSLLCFFGLVLYCISSYSQKILFLHHSTGANVYNQGGVSSWFANYNSVNETSYIINERTYPNTPYPWENYPYDYWNLWLNNACDNTDPDIECMDKLCTDYDVIIVKHCFPGAGVSADIASPSVSSSVKCIANYKLQYRALRDLMDSYPDDKFIVWTLVPLHRLATSVQSAARAREFVDWVKNDWLTEDGKSHPNIFVFDFFGLAAELNPSPVNGQTNCLKYDYEGDHTTNDSHPNLLANQTIGPIFAQFIVNTIEDSTTIPITSINISGEGGITSITTANGTLQLIATILPANATNNDVTWSIQNGTGEASVSPNGLVTAISSGTVIATATSVSNSEIFGSLEIVISETTSNLSDETLSKIIVTPDKIYLKDQLYKKILVFNILGEIVYLEGYNEEIDISKLNKGIYFLELIDYSSGIKTFKFKK